MSSKVFIPAVFVSVFVYVFPLALCRELIRKNATLFTENKRLRDKNHTLKDILADIEEEFRLYWDHKEPIDSVEKIINLYKEEGFIV